MRTERNRTARLQAQYRRNIQKQGKDLGSSSDAAEAAQEAIELAKDELHSVPGSSASWSHSNQVDRSMTPPQKFVSAEYAGSEQGSQQVREVQACSSPNSENKSGVSSISLQASKRASTSRVNGLRTVSLQPSDSKISNRIAQDVDENGNWIFLGQDTDSKPSGKVWQESSARVKDEDGRITWREVRLPSSSGSSTS